MKRARFYLGAAIVSLSCFVGIPMMFIGEDFMGDLVANVLDLKVLKIYARILASFRF